jgi:hypothetical protein
MQDIDMPITLASIAGLWLVITRWLAASTRADEQRRPTAERAEVATWAARPLANPRRPTFPAASGALNRRGGAMSADLDRTGTPTRVKSTRFGSDINRRASLGHRLKRRP